MRHPTPTLYDATTSADLAPITATINISALAHNLSELRRWIDPSCDILAVVKANAYGHGSTMIAKCLVDLGIQRFGVATVQEGSALRKEGITLPILVMGGLTSSQLPELMFHRLTPVLTNEEITCQLAETLEPHLMPYPVHIKVDTGMHRLGFSPKSVVSFLDSQPFKESLHVEGLMTHLADADNPSTDWTRDQLGQFQTVLHQLSSAGHSIRTIHAANSAGIMYHRTSHFNMVRPGLMLYGGTTRKSIHPKMALRPVMKVSSHIVHVRSVQSGETVGYGGSYQTSKPTNIAILPVGYAHGYSRSLSNKGSVLVQGHRVPIVGKICMDMMLIDVSELSEVTLGEEVVLLGQQGKEEISAEDIAECLETIPYEIMCNLGTGAHHVYEPR